MSCRNLMLNILLNRWFILLCGLDFVALYALPNEPLVSSAVDYSFALNSVYNKTYVINITNLSAETRAIELHAISQGGTILTSFQKNFSKEETTRGTSAGVIALLQANHTAFKLFYLKVFPSKNCSANYSEKVLISALSLSSKQPLPGACNLVHNANYYPLLSASADHNLVEVTFSPSNVGYTFFQKEPTCDASNSPNQRLMYNVYVHFLLYSYQNETCSNCENFSSCGKKASTGYFTEELSEIIINQAEVVGTKIKTLSHYDKPQFVLPIVPCSSVIIYITVIDPILNTSSKYVPEIIFNGNRSYDTTYIIFVKVCLVFLIAVGCALCFAGHRCFLFELFGFGGIVFCLLSYITITLCDPASDVLSLGWKWAIVLVSTLLGSFLFSGLWWRFDHHVLFGQLISFVGGFLFSCIIFTTPFANLSFFRNGVAFGVSVVIGMLVYALLLTLTMPLSRICVITSAFVGSYIVVASLGCGVFLCSMMSQIMELMLSKITVKHFIKCTIVVPLQTNDYALIGLWVVLFVSGCFVQFYLLRSQPHFPECPYKARRRQPASHTSSSSSCASGPETPPAYSDSLTSQASSYSSAHYDGDVSDDVEVDDDIVNLDDTAQLLSFSDA